VAGKILLEIQVIRMFGAFAKLCVADVCGEIYHWRPWPSRCVRSIAGALSLSLAIIAVGLCGELRRRITFIIGDLGG